MEPGGFCESRKKGHGQSIRDCAGGVKFKRDQLILTIGEKKKGVWYFREGGEASRLKTRKIKKASVEAH